MWRWLIRVWVSIVLFVFLMFCSSVALKDVTHLLVWTGFPLLSHLIHTHVLLAIFVLGVLAGQAVLGSNFTGSGWFRSKSGLTYEGFKLERLKPWTWLLVSPVFVLGVVGWVQERSDFAVWSNITFTNFYRDVLMPNCPLTSWKSPQLYPFCGEQLICVGIWMASIGYSLAPMVRKYGFRLLRSLRSANKATIPGDESSMSLMKEKTRQR